MIKGLRKLHKEEAQNLLSSEYSFKDMKCAEHVARKGKIRNAFKFLVVKPEGKRSLGKIGIDERTDPSIKSDSSEIGYGAGQWIHLRMGPVACSCNHGNGPFFGIRQRTSEHSGHAV
jgi:hypothetical protein